MKWTKAKTKRAKRSIYVKRVPIIQGIGRQSGYAIAVHGSMTRDLDLIAVPWVKTFVKPITLVRRIEKAVADYPKDWAFHYRKIARTATIKPHGRVAYAIHIGWDIYIDLSIVTVP